jgi:hypothetical protein
MGCGSTAPLASESDEMVLGKDEYLVLGDNSTNSLDGRHFGPIQRKAIIGRVAWVFAPPDRKGSPQCAVRLVCCFEIFACFWGRFA